MVFVIALAVGLLAGSATAETEVALQWCRGFPNCQTVILDGEDLIEGTIKVERQMDPGFTPALSPDGELLTFVAPDSGIHLADATVPGDPWLLVPDVPASVFNYASQVWSPTSNEIVFQYPVSSRYFNIPGTLNVVDLSGNERVIADPFWGWSPSWSPDGRWIAYSDEMRVHVVPAAGGDRRTLNLGDPCTSNLAWSSQPGMLAITCDHMGRTDVLVVDVDPDQPWDVITTRTLVELEGGLHLAWSPDDTAILTNPGTFMGNSLLLIDVATTRTTPVSWAEDDTLATTDPDTWFWPSWVTVFRNAPPVTADASASSEVIWPPNNKMVDISIEGVTDPDGDDVTITITGIADDETDADNDHAGIGSETAQVRAEREGDGDGRTYTISFIASDGQAESEGQVTVSVPHDQGGGKKNGRGKPAGAAPSWGEIKRDVNQN